MFEVFDDIDPGFLKEYEDYFLSLSNTPNSASKYNNKDGETKVPDEFKKFPGHYVDLVIYNKFFSNFPISKNYSILPRTNLAVVFQPDQPTMIPHLDYAYNDHLKKCKTVMKRMLVYASSYWNPKWQGGTYIAPFEQYEAKHRNNIVSGTYAKVSRKKFIKEAHHINYVPGRYVLFDVDDWHMPEEFSGNTNPRLVCSFLLVKKEHEKLGLELCEQLSY